MKKKIEFFDYDSGCFIEYFPHQPIIVVETKKCYFFDSKEFQNIIDFFIKTKKEIKKVERRMYGPKQVRKKSGKKRKGKKGS